ncbi:tetratricopeptide repeat protein [candidate division WOR-3 bacterium]|uniref:Tetratricopeptide repeat protein n=1 Tax=candidate division WOR-3 bacterium TaxID=2052148 RepID=A0A9D5KAE7_UNCW3|nr:tetratricopeptide repeat protein [candidate division WOR-3 bacterium]MBD3365437.1 tetratricopeptide repeat protein [candidate division WOR-3 bacterium]
MGLCKLRLPGRKMILAFLILGAPLSDGLTAARAGNYADARRILASYASGSDAAAAQANLWLARLESDPSEANETYLKIVEDFGSTPFADSALLEAAKVEYALGHYNKASTYFEKLLKSYTNSPLLAQTHYWLGMCRGILGNQAEAKSQFAKTQGLAPGSLWASLASRETSILSPAPPDTAPADTSTTTTPAAGDFAVQVGSFTERSRAEDLLSEYKASGQAGEIRQAEVSGKTYYRVWLGPFATNADAAGYAQKLEAQGKQAIVVKR